MMQQQQQQQYINQLDLKEMQNPLAHRCSSSCRYFFSLVYRYGPLQIYEDFSLFEQNALQCLLPALSGGSKRRKAVSKSEEQKK